MKTTIRDIIVNALDEARIVNRSQPVPGNIFESAYILLKKRLSRYSNTNYLSFIRKEINFIPNKEVINLGEYELSEDYIEGENFYTTEKYSDLPNANTIKDISVRAYIKDNDMSIGDHKPAICEIKSSEVPTGTIYYWEPMDIEVNEWIGWENAPDIEVNNIQEIVRVYAKPINSEDNWEELNFVSYEDFYTFRNPERIYSVLPTKDNNLKLYLKKYLLNQYDIKVMYNEFFEYEVDDELNIPQQFITLFTAALVYDLSVQYPRLSDNTVALFKEQLTELEENCRRSSAINKFIGRKFEHNNCTISDFISGKFLGV